MYRLDDEPEHETEAPQNAVTKKIDDRIDALLLSHRRLFICDAVSSDSAKETIRKLWFLELTDPGKPILLVINSPGGSVDSGFAIWDQVKMISSPVTTLVCGLAASMGSILSLCAPKGKRYATAQSRIMIHQPSIHGVIRGQATDLDIQAKEIIKTRKQIVQVYAKETGKSHEEIDKAVDRDSWFSADEAKSFGLIDKIVHSYKEIGF
jgi:ATP-dependent Clp protease protease subunit